MDILLLDKDLKAIAISWRYYGDEEIVYFLEPGQYYFKVFVSDTPFLFCETYTLFFSLFKENSTVDVCTTGQSIKNNPITWPDFTTILSQTDNYTFNGNNQVYTYPFPQENFGSVKLLTNYTFSISSNFFVRASIERNFVLGDLVFRIIRRGSNYFVNTAKHFQNSLDLSLFLQPGNYTIEILTSQVQSQSSDNFESLSNFPKCNQFSVKFEFQTQSFADNFTSEFYCSVLPNLPQTLNSPAFLEQSNYVDICDEFLIPRETYSEREIYINVNLVSFFKLYLDPNQVSITLYLFQDGRQVSRSENQIDYELQPQKKYNLKLTFSKTGNDATKCGTFMMHLNIFPVSNLNKTHCEGNNVPNTINIPSNSNLYPYHFDQTFYFTQQAKPVVLEIPFTISLSSASDNVTLMRVLSNFDYEFTQLVISIIEIETPTKKQNCECFQN
eukprot:TRINITY_DN16669_c0_g1_i1.p1 TRINITY_DN16669_c0_g1~~TRINITY_DN16669_c0_g1_i1.p1  ORF type:complete len:469 (+),score=84.01 TRINITY_DN16669_c0_g1_i1:82-1407(+)